MTTGPTVQDKTPAELEFAARIERALETFDTDADGLLRAVVSRSRSVRRRRAGALVAAAVAVLAVGSLAAGASGVLGTGQPGPAASPSAAVPTVWPPAVEPDVQADSHLHGRVAALYLAELSGREATDFGGDVDEHQVVAGVSFAGRTSPVVLDARNFLPSVTEEERTTRGFDLTVTLDTPGLWTDAADGPESVMQCGPWPDCRSDHGPDGTETVSWTDTSGAYPVRGAEITVVRVLRTDRTVVDVVGRADEFSRQRLIAIAQDPRWDVHRTPDAATQRAAESLTPYGSW